MALDLQYIVGNKRSLTNWFDCSYGGLGKKGEIMKIYNVKEIYDNGEFVTIVTFTGSVIHLPMDGKHSLAVKKSDEDNNMIIVTIDFYQC